MSNKDEGSNEQEISPDTETSSARAHLLWSILVFQAKLIADGVRDVILLPVSLLAALLGFVAGGSHPDKYFQKVISLGRRSETWINLFGQRKHDRTSDAMIEPIREKLVDEAQSSSWVQRADKNINKTLDTINQQIDTAVAQTKGNRPTNTKTNDDEKL